MGKQRCFKKINKQKTVYKKSCSLICQADLNYPNNSLSSFFYVLNDEFFLNNASIALTEICFPVDYKVFLGTITFSIPDFLIADEKNELNVKIVTKQITPILDNIDSLIKQYDELHIKRLLNNPDHIDSFKKTALLSFLNEYIQSVRRYSLYFIKTVKYVETCTKIFSFYEWFRLNYTQIFFKNDDIKNFIKDFLKKLNLINDSLVYLGQAPTKKVEINIEVPDRINSKDFLNFFETLTGNICNNKNDFLSIKPYVFSVQLSTYLNM